MYVFKAMTMEEDSFIKCSARTDESKYSRKLHLERGFVSLDRVLEFDAQRLMKLLPMKVKCVWQILNLSDRDRAQN